MPYLLFLAFFSKIINQISSDHLIVFLYSGMSGAQIYRFYLPTPPPHKKDTGEKKEESTSD